MDISLQIIKHIATGFGSGVGSILNGCQLSKIDDNDTEIKIYSPSKKKKSTSVRLFDPYADVDFYASVPHVHITLSNLNSLLPLLCIRAQCGKFGFLVKPAASINIRVPLYYGSGSIRLDFFKPLPSCISPETVEYPPASASSGTPYSNKPICSILFPIPPPKQSSRLVSLTPSTDPSLLAGADLDASAPHARLEFDQMLQLKNNKKMLISFGWKFEMGGYTLSLPTEAQGSCKVNEKLGSRLVRQSALDNALVPKKQSRIYITSNPLFGMPMSSMCLIDFLVSRLLNPPPSQQQFSTLQPLDFIKSIVRNRDSGDYTIDGKPCKITVEIVPSILYSQNGSEKRIFKYPCEIYKQLLLNCDGRADLASEAEKLITSSIVTLDKEMSLFLTKSVQHRMNPFKMKNQNAKTAYPTLESIFNGWSHKQSNSVLVDKDGKSFDPVQLLIAAQNPNISRTEFSSQHNLGADRSLSWSQSVPESLSVQCYLSLNKHKPNNFLNTASNDRDGKTYASSQNGSHKNYTPSIIASVNNNSATMNYHNIDSSLNSGSDFLSKSSKLFSIEPFHHDFKRLRNLSSNNSTTQSSFREELSGRQIIHHVLLVAQDHATGVIRPFMAHIQKSILCDKIDPVGVNVLGNEEEEEEDEKNDFEEFQRRKQMKNFSSNSNVSSSFQNSIYGKSSVHSAASNRGATPNKSCIDLKNNVNSSLNKNSFSTDFNTNVPHPAFTRMNITSSQSDHYSQHKQGGVTSTPRFLPFAKHSFSSSSSSPPTKSSQFKNTNNFNDFSNKMHKSDLNFNSATRVFSTESNASSILHALPMGTRPLVVRNVAGVNGMVGGGIGETLCQPVRPRGSNVSSDASLESSNLPI